MTEHDYYRLEMKDWVTGGPILDMALVHPDDRDYYNYRLSGRRWVLIFPRKYLPGVEMGPK